MILELSMYPLMLLKLVVMISFEIQKGHAFACILAKVFQVSWWLRKFDCWGDGRVTITNAFPIWNIFYLLVHNWIVSRNFSPPFSLSLFRHEEQPRPFVLHACLRNSDDEVRFLQTCSRVLVFCLLPSKDVQSLSLRIMLAEILTTKGKLVQLILLIQ